MKQKYGRNHKVIIFQPGDIVTLRIPKGDQAATDNRGVLVMIKSIPHEGCHEIQTRFGVMDRLFLPVSLTLYLLLPKKATSLLSLEYMASLSSYGQDWNE